MPFPPRSALSWKLLSRAGQLRALAERGFAPPFADDIGYDISIVAWCNGADIVEPHAIVMSDDDATLVIPTSDDVVTHTIAAFHDDMVFANHRGPLVMELRLTSTGGVAASALHTRTPAAVTRAWAALLTDADQLTEFYAGSLARWELQPDWPMVLVARTGSMAIGHVLTFLREDAAVPAALLDAEEALDVLRGLGWLGRAPVPFESVNDFSAQRAALEMRPPVAPEDKSAPFGEHTQTGGMENPTHAVNPSPTDPTSAGGSSSPSPSN